MPKQETKPVITTVDQGFDQLYDIIQSLMELNDKSHEILSLTDQAESDLLHYIENNAKIKTGLRSKITTELHRLRKLRRLAKTNIYQHKQLNVAKNQLVSFAENNSEMARHNFKKEIAKYDVELYKNRVYDDIENLTIKDEFVELVGEK